MKQAIEPYVFLGRPGSGKGTQAALLNEYLKTTDPQRPLHYVETGKLLRQFIKDDSSYTAQLTKEVVDSGGGGRTLVFLAIYNWTNYFVKNLQGGERVVMDGTPRSIPEAEALDTAFSFYSAERSTIIYLSVDDGWSHDKLGKRGRVDDTPEGIKHRLAWFQSDAAPVVEYFRARPGYRFLEINGNQTIEEVHQEILSKL